MVAKAWISRFGTSVFASALLMLSLGVQAGLYVAPQSNFTSVIVDFTEVPLGTPINGLTIDGFSFAEVGGNTTVTIGGPGNTNNITQPAAQSFANPAGNFVSITMPTAMGEFGFGYSILAFGTVPDGVTITLFDGVTNLGSLVYAAVPDPTFPGGFAGIGSTTPFTRAELRFSPSAVAYDFDNLRANPAPEPGTLALLGLALAGLAATRRRKQ